jgi:uncharacterized protein (DUF433 family)
LQALDAARTLRRSAAAQRREQRAGVARMLGRLGLAHAPVSRVLAQVLFDAVDDRRRGIVGKVSRLERITSDPAVCHGQPTIRGLRYTVENMLELLSAGMTIDEVLADYPDLEREDLLAALEFGARAAGRSRVVPLSAA